jgi:hypothetical protein
MEHLEYAWKMDHPADAVWKIVGDFGSEIIAKGFVDKVETVGEGIGMIRIFHLAQHLGGQPIKERLDDIDHERRSYAYSITDAGPLPFTGYSGRITVTPCGPNACYIMAHIQMLPVTATAEECRLISKNNMRMFYENVRNALNS